MKKILALAAPIVIPIPNAIEYEPQSVSANTSTASKIGVLVGTLSALVFPLIILSQKKDINEETGEKVPIELAGDLMLLFLAGNTGVAFILLGLSDHEKFLQALSKHEKCLDEKTDILLVVVPSYPGSGSLQDTSGQ